MHKSFSEFKFYQSFRIPVEEADGVRFLVEIENDMGEKRFIEDAKIVDMSMMGVGFTTKERLSKGTLLHFSVQYKKIHIDLDVEIIRAFSQGLNDKNLLYGAEFKEDELDDVKRFLEQYVLSFSQERMRDSMIQMALVDRYDDATEGIEMFSLMLSLFNDMTNFAEKDNFIHTILDEVSRIMEAQRAIIYLVNPDTNELEAKAAHGIDQKELKFDYRKGVAGSVFTTGLSLNLDLEHDKNNFAKEMSEITEAKTKTVICVPVHNREDKIIGVVEVDNKNREERFGVEDEKIMRMVSLIFSSIYHNYNPVSKQSVIRKFSAPSDRELILIGHSKQALALRNTIIKLKDTKASVLLTGEIGTGKTLLARILHQEGKRGLKAFEEVFCGNKDLHVLHQELFGENGGKSKMEEVAGGTLFLKDIHMLSLKDQQKMLDYIIAHKEKNDIRLMASSSKNMERLVMDGEFLEKLYTLFNEGFVVVPPLRKREEDIKDLINFFLKIECKKHGFLLKTLSPTVTKTLVDYDWPGNVKELKTAISRLVLYNPKAHVITSLGNMAQPILEGSKVADQSFSEIPYASDFEIALKDRLALIERHLILAEIKRYNGNKSKAAREMGISREALRKKLMISQDIQDALDSGKVLPKSVETRDQEDKEEKDEELEAFRAKKLEKVENSEKVVSESEENSEEKDFDDPLKHSQIA